MKSIKSLFRILGPGLISGAADDDPSGIATYSQGGAQFGLGVSWLALFQYPLMMAIQEMCARVGLVTGKGLVGVIKEKYSKKITIFIVGLLLIANTITIGADIGAMGSSVQLIIPKVPTVLITASFAAFILFTEVIFSYKRYAKMLKYMTLALFSYVITAFVVSGDWSKIIWSTLIPHFELNAGFLMIFLAIFGATISPYAFFWQASEEAEEDVLKNKIKEIGEGKPRITKKEMRLMRADTAVGMAFSQIIMWFIIIATANTLHINNITDIQTAAQAAKALEPLVHNFPDSGKIAEILFASGIVGTGLLAIPVLAGSSAYALSDGFGWKEGLSKKFRQAKGFYLIIIGSTVIGLWINLVNIDPIKALVYASIISGIISVPLLVMLLKISNDKKVLGSKTNGLLSNTLVWITIIILGVSVIVIFAAPLVWKQ
ncbi:MAG: divalent metal cation transporter [Nitrosotalea sp.]